MFEMNFEIDINDLLMQEKAKNNSASPVNLKIKSAEGSFLIDENNKQYLDLTSNKECNPLGYSYINKADTGFLFDSELFQTSDSIELENQLKYITGMNNTIFTSCKAESHDVCRNLIKKYLPLNNKSKILISSTSLKHSQYILEDVLTDIIPLNDEIIAKSLLTKAVGAVIVEIAQIDNEINIATSEYLNILQELCKRNNALLVIDASSLSPFRTFNGLFNFDSSLIKPDILIISNSVSHGIPFGAVLLSDKLDKIQGTASTIFAYKSALKFITECSKSDSSDIIKSNALYFEKALNTLAEKYITIADVIPYGMLFAVILDISAYDFTNACFDEGIIIEALNSYTIKLSPPYNISREEIDKLIISFEKVFDKLARYDRLN
jgi:acetylornithine aminotransferase